ncbi:MAG: tetratricopeptide repeat protein [Isosphaeraceae bacterium]|nr:tetratricopeptide repeat protein [Isosphaeraceae bacterium]
MSSEPFRALRRGLSRSDGFALFVAVCNRSADRDALIEALQESMPQTGLTVVHVRADTIDVLDEVVRQADPNAEGPVMLVDLEKAVPSVVRNHAVLQALNLQRPEWPVKIQRPVVFWTPDYLLGLFGREAPDFFDWRSDTFFFPDLTEAELRPLLAEPWDGGGDGRLSEPERRARVHELRSRLASTSESDNPFVQATHARWLNELGNHLNLLGEFAEAEASFLRALEINESLGRREGIAIQYGNLGLIYAVRGDLAGAESMYRKSLEIDESLGHREGMAADYGNLGLIYRARGDLAGAESMYRKALEIYESLGRREGMANQYGNLGLIYRARGDLVGAESMHRKALEIDESLGRREGMANQYGNLGLIYAARGDLAGAESMHRKALEIDESLGRREGTAADYGNLGLVYRARGDLAVAESMFRKSLEIEESLGHREGMARDYGNLGTIYNDRGDTDEAKALWLRAHELFTAIGMPRGVRWIQGLLDTLRAEPKGKKRASKRRR